MKSLALTFMTCLVFVVGGMSSQPAHSAGGGEHIPEQSWSFDGVFGTYDRASLQRGFQVYKQVCATCHSMEKLYYRNLSALGYNEAELKAIAAEYTVMDGPNDEGEMFERVALPSDPFISPFPNKKAAEYANNGAYPPDFSLIALAKHGGPDYLYAVLTGYEDAPAHMELLPGQYYNKYKDGHIIAMAPPLSDGLVEYGDGSPQTVSQYAKDVSHFLAWAASPELETRKQTGIKVFLFLLVFAGVMYAYKKKVWADAH